MWLNELSVSELRLIADERRLDVRDVVEKPDLLQKLKSKLIKDFNDGTFLFILYWFNRNSI